MTSLSFENLLDTLTKSSGSERSSQQQIAETQLKQWECVPGYHYLLQEIYIQTELPLQIRWLAIICFKNGIDKYWRPARENAISKEEKAQIKVRCFNLLHEQNNQLIIQNAHSISKIARYDFPTDWPLLFDEIAQLLEKYVFISNDLVSTNNLLIILNRIIKTISMVRIGRSRHALTLKAPLVITILIKIYMKSFQTWTNNLDLTLMEICYISLKILRRIIPECFDNQAKEFLNVSIEHLQLISMEYDEKFASCDLLERYIKQYSKLYVNLLTTHSTSFILLPSCSKIITTFLTILEQKAETVYNSAETNFWETLAIKGFIILKKIINFIFKGTLSFKQNKLEIESAIKKLTSEVFTPEIILHLCDLIITWYLRLKPSDLESWLLEGEEWANEELAQSWEFQVRPCAENFYQDLIKYFPNILKGFVMDKISNGLNDDKILIKDSIMCTFQLSSTIIDTSFDTLLQDIFIPNAMKNDFENKILKRRICLVINEWIGSSKNRSTIYQLLIELLQPNNPVNDLVVKISAVHTLKVVVEDGDFQKKEFVPYLNEFIKLLLSLDLDLVESKLFLFQTIARIIDECNPLIDHETLMNVLSVVPNYWENEPILKNSLMRVLKSLIVSLNENSVETHQIAFQLINSCCRENSEYYALLSEDGFDIWLAMLVYAPTYTESMNNLFGLMPDALRDLTEILPTLISILRSYSLLSPDIFQENTLDIFKTLTGYLPTMRDDSFGILITFLDVLFLTNSRNEQFVSVLLSSGFFEGIFRYILDDRQSIPQVNKLYLVLSRFAYTSPDVFLSLLSQIDQMKFLSIWLEYFNKNGNPRNKKINLLGFVTVLSKVANPNLFTQALKLAFLFLEEVSESNEGVCEAYKQDFTYEDIDDYSYLDNDIKPHGEKLRYQRLLEYDPVYTVNLRAYLGAVVSNVPRDNILGDNYVLEKVGGLSILKS